MGEPASPTKDQRLERRRLARAIVESVRNDETMPLGLLTTRIEGIPVVLHDQVTQLAFELAQEIELLHDELAAVDSGLDDWDWDGMLADAVQGQLVPEVIRGAVRTIARIAKARKEARGG